MSIIVRWNPLKPSRIERPQWIYDKIVSLQRNGIQSTDRNEYKIRFMATETAEDSSRSGPKITTLGKLY